MIVFERISFCNFLSVGNKPVTINLNEQKTTLVHGANGSGKSTILDVICYALFNKPFRRINIPQLINTQNKKGLLTEVEFKIGRTKFTVQRGQKPKVFRVFKNGKELDAKAADKDNQAYLEQTILKMNMKTFTQVVILGSSNFIPFMQLTGQGRRECVEDFLDIKVFSTMAVIAKERLRGLKDNLARLKGDMSNLEYKIELQGERCREIEKQSQSDIKELQNVIDDRSSIITGKLNQVKSLQEHQSGVTSHLKSLISNDPNKKLREFNNIVIKLTNKVERINKDVQFFIDNDNCPTCSQSIAQKTKDTMMDKSDEESIKFTGAINQARAQMIQYEDTMRIADSKRKHIESLQNSIFKLETEVQSLQREVKLSEDKLQTIQDNTGSIDKEVGKLELLEEEQVGMRSRLDTLLSSVKEHEVVASLLKDSGIKTQVVKKYLPVMNRCIRRYMTDLDFPIHFVLDKEFNETVSSPLHQNFSYSSFSEGQKSRIDLALMFCWREIGKLKNSVSTNLLVLDEVFSSSLDEPGKDALLALLRYGLDDNQRVVVVDHTLSQSFKDKFDKTIEVNRIKGFSTYST